MAPSSASSASATSSSTGWTSCSPNATSWSVTSAGESAPSRTVVAMTAGEQLAHEPLHLGPYRLRGRLGEGGSLDADRLVRLGRGLSSALGAIHAAGVVHRDLKPANVLMLDGDPVVIDFGIAHVADDVRLTSAGLVMGTPGYLSPEVVDGDPVTPATDWWGWAATVAFAASGRPPFGRGPMDVVIDRVRRGSCDLSGVDERLRPLLAAVLAVEPDRRPHALEVLHALERYAMGEQATVTVVLPRRGDAETRPAPVVAPTTPHTLRATTPAPVPPTTPQTLRATTSSTPPAPAA